MLALWRRLPVIVRAVMAGAAVAAAGIYPWAALVKWNQLYFLQVPWAVVPMALYLWLFWKYVRGEGWPQATSESRRTSLRAHELTGDIWGRSLFAGLIGLAALLPLLSIMSRVATLPAESQPIKVPPDMPFATVLLLLVMASVVAGVVEEAAFRGYMQGPIERRHGPTIAILLNGALFGLGHFTHHPDSVWVMLPYYLAVAAVYGGLAYATNSILPGLVLHAGGDIFSLTRLWTTGRPEWQVSESAPELIWEKGIDVAFVGSVVLFLLLAAAAFWAYFELARASREARASQVLHDR